MNIKKRLETTSVSVFSIYAICAAFVSYASMFALRKPFTAAMFEGISLFGVDYKIILIISQVLGYALAKFIGVILISEMKPQARPRWIILFVSTALLSLLLFALFPYPAGFVFLFFNGLPLGFLWGIVFSYLEGRRNTELLGAGLCISFVVASGVVKTIGRVMLDNFAVSEFWMPFLTGALFIPPLMLGAWFLNKLPGPNAEDVAHRARRDPMTRQDRIRMIRLIGPGLLMLVLIYVGLTIFRDLRENYMVEIWNELGFLHQPEILTYTEVPVAFVVLVIIGMMVLVRSNRKAFYLNYILFIGGATLILVATLLQELKLIHPMLWMILGGFGMYISYIAFNTFIFDRLIAMFRLRSNYGFLLYIADSFGYIGTIMILIYKNFGQAGLSWLEYFRLISYIIGFAIIALSLASWYFFMTREAAIRVRTSSGEDTW